MDWLKAIAPTLATALGGPLAGMAIELISKAIGVAPTAVTQVLQDQKLNADQIAGIQQAELALKSKAQEMGLDFEQLAVADRKSARDMQATVRSWLPAVLAMGVTLGFFGILLGLMLGYAHTSNELLVMLGGLGTAWSSVIAFYFGSSAGSQNKDQLLYNSVPNK